MEDVQTSRNMNKNIEILKKKHALGPFSYATHCEDNTCNAYLKTASIYFCFLLFTGMQSFNGRISKHKTNLIWTNKDAMKINMFAC